MYKIKFIGNNATSGSMKPIEASGEITLPANRFKRKGFRLIKNNKHIMMYVGMTSKGKHRLAHAKREGWDKGSITITHPTGKRCGLLYTALRYIGR